MLRYNAKLSLKNARKGMNDSAQLEIKNHGKSGKITRELSRNHHLLKATLLPEERGGKFWLKVYITFKSSIRCEQKNGTEWHVVAPARGFRFWSATPGLAEEWVDDVNKCLDEVAGGRRKGGRKKNDKHKKERKKRYSIIKRKKQSNTFFH